ncbi:hypothetical protein [Ideonella sp.]|jgi:hypothetical protein|uniref:hypothetical protein n=1 Tax=Ideonella sp. TaxID=1929293 RepID=UPI0037C167A5
MRRTLFLSPLTASLLLGLAACGGGGDEIGPAGSVTLPSGARGGSATAGADLNSSNVLQVGARLAKALRGDATGGVTGPAAAARAKALSARQSGARGLPSPLLLARQALYSAGPKLPTQRAQASTATISSLPCPYGGRMTVTVDDMDGNGTLSSGDSVLTNFSACVTGPGEPSLNGRFDLTMSAVTVSPIGTALNLDATATFSDFSVQGEGTLNGTVRIWLVTEGQQERFRMSYQNARLTLPSGEVQQMQYDLYGSQTDAQLNLELSGAIGLGGQLFAASSTAVFMAGPDGVMRSGSSQLRDAAGDVLQLQAQTSGRYDLTLTSASGQSLWSSLGLGW